MNKKLTAQRISQLTGISVVKCLKMLSAFTEIVHECYINDDHLQISSLGTFYVQTLKERYGVSPKTKERMYIPAKKKLSFRCSRSRYIQRVLIKDKYGK